MAPMCCHGRSRCAPRCERHRGHCSPCVDPGMQVEHRVLDSHSTRVCVCALPRQVFVTVPQQTHTPCQTVYSQQQATWREHMAAGSGSIVAHAHTLPTANAGMRKQLYCKPDLSFSPLANTSCCVTGAWPSASGANDTTANTSTTTTKNDSMRDMMVNVDTLEQRQRMSNPTTVPVYLIDWLQLTFKCSPAALKRQLPRLANTPQYGNYRTLYHCTKWC